ncbi:MAG: DUF4846 domain-containing protein [Deltaproteobacteria bacterium]|nr:DUF4846 domain-containing protein [Deltaproteobacteria bacterium]
MILPRRLAPGAVLLLLLLPAGSLAADERPFVSGAVEGTLAEALPLPAGFTRVPVAPGSFGAFLRGLPTRPAGAKVMLHDGSPKGRQDVQWRVLAVDVGSRDLQQCADAVMRLRAEYLRQTGRADQICFRFTSGDAARWSEWRAGMRPEVKGSQVKWKRTAKPDAGEATFRGYLQRVFLYAGSASFEKELQPVAGDAIAPGDVLIRGGHPGHAMVVVDLIEGPGGERRFALAQSYMPAQEIHVVRGPSGDSPWFPVQKSGELKTPEWAFTHGDFRRFGESCPGREP